jgi:hypothetical protein
MNKRSTLYTLFFLIFMLYSCASTSPTKKIAGYATFTTDCAGSEFDGSVTLKAWGNGRNYFDATEQAKKNAVRDVLFKGIRTGRPDCPSTPLVLEIGAQQKYEDYFAAFFSDNGPYEMFVNLKDERIGHKLKRDKKGAQNSVTESAIVRVKRLELKKKLIEDKIIVN